MYYYSITDDKGYVHSIDNCVLNYYLLTSISSVLGIIKDLGSENEYWERLNCSSCPKWSFYQNHIHFDDGIYLKVGHYADFDKKKKEFKLLPMMCVEVNPNKHFEKKSFADLLFLIDKYCTSGYLIRYDYAIDIPVEMKNVKVFKTRKEKGLYKGTEYFGQRNTHGFCKIYDKGKERELSSTLTRVEHTLSVNKPLSLVEFNVLSCVSEYDINDLTSLDKAVVALALKVQALGGSYEDELSCINYRSRKKIEPYLSGNYEKYEYDVAIIEKLLKKVKDLFMVSEIEVDADGFMTFDGESPFDI